MTGSAAKSTRTAHALTWACAEPVHLSTGIDHVRLDAPLDPALDDAECREVIAALNAAVADRDVTFVALDARRWLMASRDEIVCAAHDPPAVAGRDIRDLMPDGRDGQFVRRLMNELQMVLHEHPVNELRAAQGRRAANAIWLWGFGVPNEPEHVELPPLAGDDEWLTDLWRLHRAVVCATPGAAMRRASSSGAALIACVDAASTGDAGRRLLHCEAVVFAPLRRAIETGSVRDVRLLCGTRPYRFGRVERWSIWRRPRVLGRRTS